MQRYEIENSMSGNVPQKKQNKIRLLSFLRRFPLFHHKLSAVDSIFGICKKKQIQKNTYTNQG
jgi:hypothetical protein